MISPNVPIITTGIKITLVAKRMIRRTAALLITIVSKLFRGVNLINSSVQTNLNVILNNAKQNILEWIMMKK